MPRRFISALLVLAILPSIVACDSLGPALPLPAGAEPITPPGEYLVWWNRTESCARLHGDLNRIEWYVVPDVTEFETPDGPRAGLWSHSSAGVRIVLAGDFEDTELVVRHEMLHALLNREGHPAEFFRNRCHLTWDTWSTASPALPQ